MTYNSQDLLKQFGEFMQTFQRRGISAFSKQNRQFWSKQPQHGQMRVLLLLNKKDHLTNSQIVEALDIRPSSVSVMIKKLAAEGLVERHDSKEDKRISFISLTDKGRESIASTHSFKQGFADELFSPLSEDEQQTLGELLKKLTVGLDDKFTKWDEGEERPDFLDHLPNSFFKGNGGQQGWKGFNGQGFDPRGYRNHHQNGDASDNFKGFDPNKNGIHPNQNDFDPDNFKN
ncbi:MarR family winged helix-turn-helix transcriptional regulator [Secundilactobacillus folii]|uniref:MarR family transcriptional regulator n=1 Tax=Secundilactobacillus folii TaxID=2678357 RepID=A0A7X2XZH7_9LACO|nr:MarR family winged helix-turn-helix transcriptional regulator [Secundilactobacillus folii]MTV83196.1 MarR family transcriptional regulator [Secundilactobacillus folii]